MKIIKTWFVTLVFIGLYCLVSLAESSTTTITTEPEQALSALATSTTSMPSDHKNNPWEKFSLSVGAFFSATDSGVRLGAGLGVDLDVEKVLDLDSRSTVFRADSLWRFTHNRRHRLDASWFALRRSASRNAGENFDFTDRNGNTVTVTTGTTIDTKFNLDIMELAYSYSFLQDDRVDLAVGGGLYVMPIKFQLDAGGLVNAEGKMKFTAPLPVLAFRMDVALTPKWYIRTGSQIFYIEYGGFTGRLSQVKTALEYRPVKLVGVGLGYDNMQFNLTGSGKDYPSVDLTGDVRFQYTGLQLYGKLFF